MNISFNKPLPFSIFSFAHWDLQGKEQLCVLVKGKFAIHPSGRLQAYADKPDISFSDVFYGKANYSSLKSESDIAPFKPKTDITFNAVARSPEAKELTSWPIRFDVSQRLSYSFHVQGKRQFEPYQKHGLVQWQLSDAEAMTELPLTYEFAYGGTVPSSEEEFKAYAYNPIGRGFVSDYLLQKQEPISAPQIGLLAELNAMKIGDDITVCGCGAITKSWLPRLAFAGTLDDAWQRERHPLMPNDFDNAYWNGAPLPLQVAPYLKGDETITVSGLFHEPLPYSFKLPGAGIGARVRRVNTLEIENVALQLDTVHCDIGAQNKEEHNVTLIWRIVLHEHETIDDIVLHLRALTDEPQEDLTAKRQREQKENEEARKILIEQKKHFQTMMEQSGLTLKDINLALVHAPVAFVTGQAKAQLYVHPETQQPFVINEGETLPIHIGKPEFIYGNPDFPEDMEVEAPDKDNTTFKINDSATIYVRLMNENVDVWRPVQAVWHGDDLYYIHMQQAPHDGETWEFNINEKVICKWRAFKEGNFLVAVEKSKFS